MASLKALTLASFAVLGLTRVAAAADLLPPPPAMEPPPPIMSAPGLGGWYLRGDVGVAASASNPSLQNSPDPLAGGFYPATATQSYNNSSISAAAFYDVGVGYQANQWLRGDVSLEYRGGSEFQSMYLLNNPGGLNAAGGVTASQYAEFYRGNVSSVVALVNAYADLGTWYGLTPFVGAGVGLAHNKLSGVTDQGLVTLNGATGGSGGYFTNGAQTNFAWALMAGIDYNITPNLKLELGYRYLNLGKYGTGGSNCLNGNGGGGGFSLASCGGGSANYIKSTNSLAYNDFRLGFRYMLGDTPAPAPDMPLVRRY